MTCRLVVTSKVVSGNTNGCVVVTSLLSLDKSSNHDNSTSNNRLSKVPKLTFVEYWTSTCDRYRSYRVQ